MKQTAIGARGSWFATVGTELLPCTHQHWIKGNPPVHQDPNYNPDNPKWIELFEALQLTKKTVVTTDEVLPDNAGFIRTGYVAVFGIDAVRIEDGALTFSILSRECELE